MDVVLRKFWVSRAVLALLLSASSVSAWGQPVEHDDFTADVTSSGYVDVGAVIQGELEQPQDRDWIGVTLRAHTPYKVTVTAENLSSVQVSLLKADGKGGMRVLASSSAEVASLEAIVVYAPPNNGYFYLAVASGSNSVGSYALQVKALSADGANAGETSGSEDRARAEPGY